MENSGLARNLSKLRERIAQTARGCSRDPSEIRLLAVSKTFSAEIVRDAWEAGQILFGENRVQEAEVKAPQLSGLGIEWHLIGHLQSNKARKAVEIFDVIQTVDSEKLMRRLDRIAGEVGKRQKVYLQVNVGDESQKSGLQMEEAAGVASLLDSLPNLEFLGLMAIPPWDDDPERSRPYFRRMSRFLAELNGSRRSPLGGLSMGMSHDFEVAIQEGATLVRVGTAIFGERGAGGG